VTRQFKDWRRELERIDADIIRLCELRVRLAIDLLRLLRSELTLGELRHDADRLSLLLFETGEGASSVLDQGLIMELFQLLTQECRRLAELEIRFAEQTGGPQSNLISRSDPPNQDSGFLP